MRTLLAKLDVEGFLFDVDGDLPEALPQIDGATLVALDHHTLDLDMPRSMDLNRVFAVLGEAGIRVRSMRTKSNRLEELFVRMTGLGNAAQHQGEAARSDEHTSELQSLMHIAFAVLCFNKTHTRPIQRKRS